MEWGFFRFLTTGDRMFEARIALVAQLVERVLGKDEVTGSSPVKGSIIK